jgi:hypothetical protein
VVVAMLKVTMLLPKVAILLLKMTGVQLEMLR